jgi:hypothetical protein
MRAASPAGALGHDALGHGRGAVRGLALRLGRVRPLWIVAALAPVQWLIALLVALRAPHNGWYFYSGGDATAYWAHEWALSHGHLGSTVLGYGVPVFLAWVPKLFGPTQLTGAIPIVFLQVLVLGTVALASVYGIAARLAGRVFAAWAAALWVLAPVLAIPLWRPDYHERYTGLFLPQALGIVNLGDFPSMVVVLAGSYFVFRTLDTGSGNDAVLAGLLLGLAIGIKPANALLLPAPVLAFALARRWRQIPTYAVALLPALITLAIWKVRGLGHLPLLSAPEVRQAVGASIPVLPRVGHYLQFSASHFGDNMAQIREFFWSRLLLEFLGAAGAVAALRKAPAKAVYLIAWFAAIVVVKGGAPVAEVKQTSFFRVTMPGFPAYLLLAACVVLLVPRWGRTLRRPRSEDTFPQRTRALTIAVVVLAALPLAAVAAARPAPPELLARNDLSAVESPISHSLAISTERIPDGVRLRWTGPDTNGAKVFYIVYRTDSGNGCVYQPGRTSEVCLLQMGSLGHTAIRFLDDTPTPGRYTYRVAISVSWTKEYTNGDVILLSPPKTVVVRCTTARCRRDVAAQRAAGTIA